MGSRYLFAAGDDWLPVFDSAEASGEVSYVRAGVSLSDQLLTFSRGAQLPDRGLALARASIECPYYLASASSSEVRSRAVTAIDGVTRFHIDQLENPQTIEVCPGGQWDDRILISGRIATVSDAPASLALYRRFDNALRRHFVRVRAYLVGPEARKRLSAGWRLTTAAHSPRVYDLVEDSDQP